MPQIITSLLDTSVPITSVSLLDILAVLPDSISFNCNIAFGGRWLRDGSSFEKNILFFCDLSGEVPNDLKIAFSSCLTPLGLTSTVINQWNGNLGRLYNNGKLCRDRATGDLLTLPQPINIQKALFTYDQFKALLVPTLPEGIPFYPQTSQAQADVDPLLQKIWLTGSLTQPQKATFNDIDLMVGEPEYDANGALIGHVKFTDKVTLATIRNYFQSIMPLPVQVGQSYMLNREPPIINSLLIYSGGKLCLQ